MQSSLFPPVPTETQERIDRALADSTLTGCARAVLIVLASRPAVGREHAISIADLQRVFRFEVQGGPAAGRAYSDREIKGSVKALIETFRVPIGSARQEPYGYWILRTPEERDEAVRPIRAEVISLLNRWRVLDNQSAIAAELAGQIALEAGQ